jgi:WD40 repeat protein/serine/threonine protein kinase/tetratricopeptide (TPR) repeat protein
MSTSESKSAVVLELAEEFLDRYRRGERPALKEYLDRHPDLAAEIREVFPAMAMMENIALADESLEAEAHRQPPVGLVGRLEQLGDYRIIREVGHGGMGIVYEAEQVSLGRHVALKVLPRKLLLDAKQKRRFEREAKAAAKLHHTNIVPVFGVGEHDGMPYYVMQFIQGLALDDVLDELRRMQGAKSASDGSPPARDRRAVTRTDLSAAQMARSLLTGQYKPGAENDPGLTADSPPAAGQDTPTGADASDAAKKGKLSESFSPSSSSVILPGPSGVRSGSHGRKPTYWQSVAQIGVQVAEALEHAHGQGILHRDIKPSNLLLDMRGTVWVTDFGLAKAEDQQNLTHTGDVLGTLRYMPPEAFEGQTGRRGDIYSLGLTLYEMLALRPAFEEKDRHRLVKLVTTQAPQRLDRLNRSAPRDLVTIIHKAIDRDPAHRYASAADLSADLQRFIDDEPVQARRVSVRERCWRWCRRNPALASAAGLAAVALVAVTILSTLFALAQARLATQQTQSNEDLRQEQERTAVALKKSTQLALELDLKLGEIRKISVWAAVERGQSLIEQGQLRRGMLWLTRGLELAPADDRNLQNTIRTNLASLRGELPILRTTFAYPYHIWSVAFSPDGRTVAVAGGDNHGEVRFYDSATGRSVGPILRHDRPIYGVTFSPEGKTLMTADSSLGRFWEVATGKEIGQPWEPPGMVTTGAVSPDGKTIALGTWASGGQTRLYDAATRKPIGQPLEHQDTYVLSIAFSPDGKTLATATGIGEGRGECRLWDAATGKPRGEPMPHPTGIVAVTFSPDGKTIATAGGRDLKARLWDVASGKLKGKPLDHQGDNYAVAFSSDGRLLLTSGGGMVRLWAADTGQSLGEPLPGPSQFALSVPFNPDGQSILIPGADKTARLWSLPTGRQVRPPLFQPGGVSALALSHDGQRLLVRSGSSNEGELRLWDASLDKAIGPARTHAGWYYAAALSPDGKTILMGSGYSGANAARLWDGTTGKPIGEPLRFPSQIFAVTFSPDGKTILIGGGTARGQKGEVELVDAASGKAIGPPLVLPGAVWAVAFSPDGKTFLTGSSDTIVQDGEVRLWDADTRKEIGSPHPHRGRVSAVAFAPDGKIIASGSHDGIARLWNATSGEPIGTPMIHQSEVNAIAFSPDGQIVATASDDRKVHFWNAATARPIGVPLVHSRSVNSVVFTSDGTTLVTGSDDRMIRFWRVPTPPRGEVEQIKAWAEWTSGLALSPEGVAGELEASAWEARREKLASSGEQLPASANPFAPTGGHGLTEHLRQVLSYMEAEDWQAALWHLDREIRSRPDAWLAHVLQTKARLQLGQQDQAAAAFTKAFELGPPDQVLSWYRSFAVESADSQQWPNAFWYLDRLIAAQPDDAALYRDRARAYLKRKDWKEAVKAYDEVVKHNPADPQMWREQGNLDNDHGRWQEAAKAFAKALELDPDDHWERYHSATLHLYIGDLDGYRRDYHELLRRFGQTDDPTTAERTAKVCLLLPAADGDQELVQRLAQLAVGGNEKHAYYGFFQLAKGMAEYRAGHFEQAMQWLRGSQKANLSSLAPFKALAHLFLAMAHYRQGHADEARTALAQATTLINAEVQKWKPDDGNMGNHDWFMSIIVRKEAEALIAGKPAK